MQPWTDFLQARGHAVYIPTLPGRDPSDDAVLARTGIDECFRVVRAAYDEIGEPAVVIGHSFGGLLAQKLAAARDPLAAVLLASVPPGVLWTQPTMVGHLLSVLPSILAAKPFRPSDQLMRVVPLSTLPRTEQDELMPQLVRDSGRVFREMSLGAPSTRVDPKDVTCPVLCVSAVEDRNVAQWLSRRFARRYGAEHQVHPDLPHWIVVASAVDRVAPPVLDWLARKLD